MVVEVFPLRKLWKLLQLLIPLAGAAVGAGVAVGCVGATVGRAGSVLRSVSGTGAAVGRAGAMLETAFASMP